MGQVDGTDTVAEAFAEVPQRSSPVSASRPAESGGARAVERAVAGAGLEHPGASGNEGMKEADSKAARPSERTKVLARLPGVAPDSSPALLGSHSVRTTVRHRPPRGFTPDLKTIEIKPKNRPSSAFFRCGRL